MNYLIKGFSYVSLLVGGWRSLSPEVAIDLQQPGRKVAVIPHTSYWDFFWGLMYCIRYDLENKVRFAMAAKVYDRFVRYPVIGNMIRRSCFRITPQRGCVEEIAEELEKMDDFIFMIAPAGTRTDDPQVEWKTGFLRVCKATRSDLCVLGVDYSRNIHSCVLKYLPPVDTIGAIEDEKTTIQQSSDLRQLVNGIHSLNTTRFTDVYNLDPVTLSTLLPFLTSLFFLLAGHGGWICLPAVVSFAVSILYHSEGEADEEVMEVHTYLMSLLHVVLMTHLYLYLYTTFPLLHVFLMTTIYVFYLGGGQLRRQPAGIYSKDYYETMAIVYNVMATDMILWLMLVSPMHD